MKLPYSWLNEYLTEKLEIGLITDKFTHIGHMLDGQIKEVAGDQVMDLEVRQNRFDCYSVTGLAREVAAVTSADFVMPELADLPKRNQDSNLKLNIENQDLCLRMSALCFDNIQITQSPDWLINKLDCYGIKAINNVVDITNYIMVELGQPLHAYDKDLLEGDALNVRLANQDEKMTVLGGKQLNLTQQDLLITDLAGPVALAGIIGGTKAEVGTQTNRVVLESATFNQATVRRSSARHQIRTEASTRHEKFNHPQLAELALQRFTYLLKLIQPTAKLTGYYDNYPSPAGEKVIRLKIDNIGRLGGVNLTSNQVSQILNSLEFNILDGDEHSLRVLVPYFRTDVDQEEDLIEEVLRIYGYDQIPEKLPTLAPPLELDQPLLKLEDKLRDLMASLGFDEQITEPLTNEPKPTVEPIKLENSLTSEKIMLRTTLQHDLARGLLTRKKHRQSDIRIFEVGKIYLVESGEYKEVRTLGFVYHNQDVTYRDVKGIVEQIFLLSQKLYDEKAVIITNSNDSFFVQINLELLATAKDINSFKVHTSIPQLVYQDFSFIVNQDVRVGEMISFVKDLDELIYAVNLGEDPITKEDNKSVFLKISYGGTELPVTVESVDKLRQKVIDLLENKFGAKFPSSS